MHCESTEQCKRNRLNVNLLSTSSQITFTSHADALVPWNKKRFQ